jgi:hypothetical protein
VLEFQNQLSQVTYSKKNIYKMKKIIRLTESKLTRIIKRVIIEEEKKLLTEGISNDVVDTIYNAHPGPLSPSEFFPLIIPKQYEATEGTEQKPRKWWLNTCATKMSLALLKSGYSVPGQYKTEVEYDGVPAKSSFNPSSQAMIGILGKNFGTKKADGYQKIPMTGNGVPKEIMGKKGVYVITTDAFGSSAAGHTDVWDGSKSKSGFDNWWILGTLHFWGAPTQLETNTINCGWGNDSEGYEKSNWKCYDDLSLTNTPAKNAKKCGYGDDVKSYRESGWKCKTKY